MKLKNSCAIVSLKVKQKSHPNLHREKAADASVAT